MKIETATSVSFTLDGAEVAALHDFLTRALRILDDARRCSFPEGACGLARDLRDTLAAAVPALEKAEYPVWPTEAAIVPAIDAALRAMP